jgi:hypothetical protein
MVAESVLAPVTKLPPINYPTGNPKREAFRDLITLLYKLKATEYINVPVTSNAYHLVSLNKLKSEFQSRN